MAAARRWGPRLGFCAILGVGPLLLEAGVQKSAQPAAPERPAESRWSWEDIQTLYEDAKAAGENVPATVAEWAKDELSRLGTWEYRVTVVPVADLTALERSLNDLGRDRWEVFWVERHGETRWLFLKRPARTLAQSLPLADILRRLPVPSPAEREGDPQ